MNYVVGFLFSSDYEKVVLIRKLRPALQVGKLNGPGGKIISGETGFEAMRREFKEETCLDIKSWYHFANLVGEGYDVRFFRSVTDNIEHACTVTDEQIEIIPVKDLCKFALLPNVQWLIHMALSFHQGENCTMFQINELYSR